MGAAGDMAYGIADAALVRVGVAPAGRTSVRARGRPGGYRKAVAGRPSRLRGHILERIATIDGQPQPCLRFRQVTRGEHAHAGSIANRLVHSRHAVGQLRRHQQHDLVVAVPLIVGKLLVCMLSALGSIHTIVGEASSIVNVALDALPV